MLERHRDVMKLLRQSPVRCYRHNVTFRIGNIIQEEGRFIAILLMKTTIGVITVALGTTFSRQILFARSYTRRHQLSAIAYTSKPPLHLDLQESRSPLARFSHASCLRGESPSQ
jgi:hypothetical protein